MRIIEISAQENGAHRNQTVQNARVEQYPIPSGWALVPDNMETQNFPFGDVETEVIDGILTVTRWTAREIPQPEPVEPTEEDDIDAMLVDHELRISLLEIGGEI